VYQYQCCKFGACFPIQLLKMKRFLTGCLLFVSLITSAQNEASPGKWLKLFNGKDLEDWKVKIKDHPLNENYGNTFRVENGVMKVSYDQYDSFKQQFGHIYYKQKFTAYLLVVEYRFTGEQAK